MRAGSGCSGSEAFLKQGVMSAPLGNVLHGSACAMCQLVPLIRAFLHVASHAPYLLSCLRLVLRVQHAGSSVLQCASANSRYSQMCNLIKCIAA